MKKLPLPSEWSSSHAVEAQRKVLSLPWYEIDCLSHRQPVIWPKAGQRDFSLETARSRQHCSTSSSDQLLRYSNQRTWRVGKRPAPEGYQHEARAPRLVLACLPSDPSCGRCGVLQALAERGRLRWHQSERPTPVEPLYHEQGPEKPNSSLRPSSVISSEMSPIESPRNPPRSSGLPGNMVHLYSVSLR